MYLTHIPHKLLRVGLLVLVPLLGWATPSFSQDFSFDTPTAEIGEQARNAFRPTTASAGKLDGVNMLFQLKQNRITLANTLYQDGYFQADILVRINGQDMDQILAVDAPNTISTVSIHVKSGQRFQFGDISVTPIPPNTTIPAPPKGAVRLSKLENYILDMVQIWQDQGYLETGVAAQDIVANHSSGTLTARVTLNTGVPSNYAGTRITPNLTTVKSVKIRSIIGLGQGENLDSAKLRLVEMRLRRTGAFSQVSVKPEPTDVPGALNLGVTLRDRKPKRIEATVALSSQDGFSIDTTWMHRNLSRNADRLTVNGEITHIQDGQRPFWGLGIDYKRPAAFRIADANLETGFALGEKSAGGDRIRYVKAYFGAEVPKDDQTTYRVRLNYKQSRNVTVDGSPTITSLSFPLQYTFDGRTDRLDPKGGHYIAAQIEPLYQLDQSVSGLKLQGEWRHYVPLSDTVVLAGRGHVGHTILSRSDAVIDPDFLYFSGGSKTVRGYSFETLGRDVRGTGLSGAQGRVILSAELRKTFVGSLSGVAFADYAILHPFGLDHWGQDSVDHSGYGLGLRYKTGLGPIRFDVAHPTDRAITLRSAALYFGLGQAF